MAVLTTPPGQLHEGRLCMLAFHGPYLFLIISSRPVTATGTQLTDSVTCSVFIGSLTQASLLPGSHRAYF